MAAWWLLFLFVSLPTTQWSEWTCGASLEYARTQTAPFHGTCLKPPGCSFAADASRATCDRLGTSCESSPTLRLVSPCRGLPASLSLTPLLCHALTGLLCCQVSPRASKPCLPALADPMAESQEGRHSLGGLQRLFMHSFAHLSGGWVLGSWCV